MNGRESTPPQRPTAEAASAARALKTALRDDYRRRRRDLDAASAARETAQTVATCLELLRSRRVEVFASYLAARDELDPDALHRAWWAAGKRVLVPRVASLAEARLEWCVLEPDTALRNGAFGIREPDPALATSVPLPGSAAVIVPGVAFAADGSRLGQGAGYYDRLLAGHRGLTIGVGYACQLCERIPVESHDRALDAVVLGGTVVRAPSFPG